jgi:hypothetical protein
MSKKKESIRLSLDLSPKTNAVLERLAGDVGVSKADVLRRSIALMKFAVEAKNQNRRLGAVDKDGNLVTEIVGL